MPDEAGAAARLYGTRGHPLPVMEGAVVDVTDCNWTMIEACIKASPAPTAVVPLGCTEQHAHLSLCTDSILARRVALEAADPLGVPVFPVLAYGITPGFVAYPGTVSLRVETYLRVVSDILDSLATAGFVRILLVNGHGGNVPAGVMIREWMAGHAGVRVKLHNWWSAPRTMAKVSEIDPVASHASWMESFPWTRVSGAPQPAEKKPMTDRARLATLSPGEVRSQLGDGNFGGYYRKPDETMQAIHDVAVQETRDAIEGPWGPVCTVN